MLVRKSKDIANTSMADGRDQLFWSHITRNNCIGFLMHKALFQAFVHLFSYWFILQSILAEQESKMLTIVHPRTKVVSNWSPPCAAYFSVIKNDRPSGYQWLPLITHTFHEM